MQRLLYILLLFAAAGARAQQMPERRDVRQGNQLYDRSDYLGAAERYTQALDKDPACYEALYNLGNAFSKAGMHEKAERTITRAAADTLRTDADRAQAFYNLGNTQFQQKKYKEALESYRRSLLLDPDDMEAKYNFAYTKKLLEQQQDDDNNGGGKGNGGEGGGQNDNNQNNDDEQTKTRKTTNNSPATTARKTGMKPRRTNRPTAALPTRKTKRATTDDRSPTVSPSRKPNRCSTPSRPRKTGPRKNSRRNRAAWSAAGRTGDFLNSQFTIMNSQL